MRYVLLAALLLAACGQGPAPSPTPRPSITAATDPCHQGTVWYCVLNPAVTQATIDSTICRTGWTRTIRPPLSYTSALKRRQMTLEGLTGSPSSYEEDHRMPLELGGAPRDPTNLSPEVGRSPNPKDADETTFRELVCSGQLTLVEAQQQFVTKWLAVYPGYRQ